MPANLASTAVLNGDIDYNGAVTGTIGAAVRGQPMKVLLFTVAKPLLFLVSKRDIKDMKQLKGKKIAGSSPGGSATLIADKVLRHYGLEPGKDVSLLPMGGAAASRYAVLRNRVVDASFLSVPENIIAWKRLQRTRSAAAWLPKTASLPRRNLRKTGRVYRMVRAKLAAGFWDPTIGRGTLRDMTAGKRPQMAAKCHGFPVLTRTLREAGVRQVLVDLRKLKVTKPVG
jgi:hypothetical protein